MIIHEAAHSSPLSIPCLIPKGPNMRLTVGIAAVVVALCQLSSSAQAAEKFAPKYAEDSKSVSETETNVAQTLTIAGMPIETKQLSFTETTYSSGKRDADGNLSVEEIVSSLRASMELPGGLKVDFDSANPDKKADNPVLDPVLDIYRTLLKMPVTTVVNSENKVQEVKVDATVLDKLPMEVRTSLEPERQKRDHEQAWLFLPDGEVEKGAEWERFIDRDLGGGQSMNFKTKYSYAGTEAKDGKTYHKFNVKQEEVTYAMDPNANPMLKVPKSDLKIDKSSGVILYDPATGEVAVRESTIRITGTMTMVINGMELPAELDLTLTEKTKTKK
jgi:hypothetical protein